MHAENGLPDTIYYQIDGGSENIAKLIHAMCELLIVRGLTKKIVLSRLMVGHTHEDIDARFAVIWTALRSRHLLSPQSYASAICGAFGSQLEVKVKDVWVVPNYTHFLSKNIDKKFGRYAKMEWTQLQFIFESVDKCVDFPNGVKTSYRRYCADKVIEIETSKDEPCGFVDRECLTETFPSAKHATETTPARPSGMYILKDPLVFSEMVPCGFKLGGREEYDETVKKIKGTFDEHVVKEWEDFGKQVPENDDVQLYLKDHPTAMHIPFQDILFKNVVAAGNCGIPPVSSNASKGKGRQRSTVVATECVLWSNRGDPSVNVTSPTVPFLEPIPQNVELEVSKLLETTKVSFNETFSRRR